MGGKAFTKSKPPLYTPRLLPELYIQLRDHYLGILRRMFEHVETPIEAPDKADHGDIDIVVTSPIRLKVKELTRSLPTPLQSHREDPLRMALVVLLQPRLFINTGKVVSYAVPHPNLMNAYVQLDIEIFSTFEAWRWRVFLASHGGLWSLLRAALKPFGLTASGHGFCVRDADIETLNKERSRIYLSQEPSRVLEFLRYEANELEHWSSALYVERRCEGLEPDQALRIDDTGVGSDTKSGAQDLPVASNDRFKGLPSTDSLFAFVTRSRFFRKSIFKPSSYVSSHGHIAKRNQAQDEIYRRFVDECVPGLPDKTSSSNLSSYCSSTVTDSGDVEQKKRESARERQISLEEALERWGKKEKWVRLRNQWEREQDTAGDVAIAKALRSQIGREEMEYMNAWVEAVEGRPIRKRKGKEKRDEGR